ncbi:MAG TPA: glycine--tRNA ligase subunit beta, partial [Allosphingosinicella sp.]
DKPGRPTAELLAEAIPAIVRAFPWPKSMRWGAASASTASLRWVRPLQGIIALLGDQVVPFEIAGVASGATTVGHRFHHAGIVTIGCADDYAAKLRACRVLIDPAERRRVIAEGAAKAAAEAGLVLVEDEGLLAENAGLTEWPVPLLGAFDPAFLEVPREVIQLTKRTNQKYFALLSSPSSLGEGDHLKGGGGVGTAGELAPNFICTANIEAADGGKAIVAGNEKVLAARLADAKFFWEHDLKIPLEEQAKKLSQIVFHDKLGTVADKVDRVAKLARWLVEEGIVRSSPSSLGEGGHAQHGGGARSGAEGSTSPSARPLHRPADRPPPPGKLGEDLDLADAAETAARLCKADLVTGMVGEFPELQGIIGGYLARAQGHSDAIADAIRDHYKPVGQGDEVPTAPVTVAVSLADKWETLSSFFEIEEKPTGSKDPFALRRAALGVIRLIVENDLRVSLYRYHAGISGEELIDFFADRLKVQQREAGVRHDLIDAVFALGGEDDLVRLLARVHALQHFVQTPEGENLLAGYKRAANILKKENWTHEVLENKTLSYTPENEEAALIAALDSAEPRARAAVEAEDFEGAMGALASLRAPVDAFFDKVTVNDPDPAKRAARLDLLARMRAAVHEVADFSKIEG